MHIWISLLAYIISMEKQMKQMKYKIINLQNLEPRTQTDAQPVTESDLTRTISKKFRWISKPALYYEDTGLDEKRIIHENGVMRYNFFFDAFLRAYRNHGNVVMIPDEIWITILFFFSKYVQEHSEALREKLVKHEGKKILVVKESILDKKEGENLEMKWDNFFTSMTQQIEENTINGIVEKIACDFTTTNRLYKTISTSLTMGALHKFFDYHRRLCICGINNVYMGGQREDWQKMVSKLEKLGQFDVDGKLLEYINHIKIILQNFVQTWDEKPDLQWWNTVMKTSEQRQVYGGQQTDIQGWIMHFLGIYQKQEIISFPQLTIKVPIKLINQETNTTKQLVMVSDWVSVSKLNHDTYKPDIGLSIVQVGERDFTKK